MAAKLMPPFILCPLAERKEFLGISSDQQENKVILTIGKNIAIRYHVLEQKQEVSWISSRHWFTSRVIYCPDVEKYAAVIDYSTLILFDENDSNLASMKKYKFAKPIFELKSTESLGTLMVFKNGTIKNLAKMIGLKKQTVELELTDRFDTADQILLQTEIDERRNQAVLVIGFTNEVQTIAKCGMDIVKRIKVIVVNLLRIKSDVSQDSEVKYCATVQKNEEILGFAVNKFSDIGNVLIYLCSDGYLYQQLLAPRENNDDNQSSTVQENSSSKVAYLEKYISCSNAVIIQAIDSTSVIVYGCDASEEGACALVYDISYNILISKQSVKLYSSPPMMEKVGCHLFVPVGLHILVLSLKLTKARLSAVVGKHQMNEVDLFEKRDPFIQPWHSLTMNSDGTTNLANGDIHEMELGDDYDETGTRFSIKKFEKIYKLVKLLERDGQPESMICTQIVPQAIEANNIEALKWINEYFYDIPESALISILMFLLNSADKGSNVDITNLMNQMLERNFDQRQLLHEFRKLDFETVKIFLEYFWDRMNELWSVKVVCEDSAEAEDVHKHNELLQIFKWTCAIFDAQYPQFVGKNETELIDKIIEFLNDKFKLMEEVETLEPLLTLILSKISYEPKPARNTKYRVETVTFE